MAADRASQLAYGHTVAPWASPTEERAVCLPRLQPGPDQHFPGTDWFSVTWSPGPEQLLSHLINGLGSEFLMKGDHELLLNPSLNGAFHKSARRGWERWGQLPGAATLRAATLSTPHPPLCSCCFLDPSSSLFPLVLATGSSMPLWVSFIFGLLSRAYLLSLSPVPSAQL